MSAKNKTDADLISRALQCNSEAYSDLVERYRSMVYGVAYSYVGDFETARDIAQDTFIRMYQYLGTLRDKDRFAAYIRRIVVNECRAYLRERKRSADYVGNPSSLAFEQEKSETKIVVQQALKCLSLPCRQTVVLYYFGEFTYEEIARFLGVPVTTIKSRLRDARIRLRKEMIDMVEATIQLAPLAPTFTEDVIKRLFDAAYSKDNTTLHALLTENTQLAFARYKYTPIFNGEHILEVAASTNNSEGFYDLTGHGALEDLKPDEAQRVLYNATFHQNQPIAALALQHGAKMDVFSAALIGDTRTMRRLLKEDPELVHARGPQGETPLHDAMNIEIVRLLLEYGADIEAVDTTYGNTPAEFGIWNRSATSYLIERGAKVSFDLACHLNDAIRVRAYLETDPSLLNVHSGPKRPEARTLPIRAAATAGALEVIEVLIEFGADINTRDEQGDGETPLHAAARRGYRELVTFLLERGADPDIRTISGLKPSHYAEDGKRRGWQAAIGIAEHDAVIALLKDHEAA